MVNSNGSILDISQISLGDCSLCGGLSLVFLRTLLADHQSHHRDTDEAKKVIYTHPEYHAF